MSYILKQNRWKKQVYKTVREPAMDWRTYGIAITALFSVLWLIASIGHVAGFWSLP